MPLMKVHVKDFWQAVERTLYAAIGVKRDKSIGVIADVVSVRDAVSRLLIEGYS